ncbi:toxin-antitoxin system TumE family protein [Microseira wollei]|uniref:Uncharacterized protein n=1 Tax=Microseira wollei NIES-4236 TaxID=2530354 RepID=A0AAV3X8J7_9CYAN|nr:DUF6516 family protein [Microseira wollei]GET39137.1 hypothetical protein MiSe_39010 [Microseira wollei NIES-4236]
MTNAGDYLAHIKAQIVLNPQVVNWTIVREEEQGNRGLLRYRLTLKDNSFLEMFEFFIVTAAGVQVTKYRFHWQSADGQLHKRWDNAAHHPEIATYPLISTMVQRKMYCLTNQ